MIRLVVPTPPLAKARPRGSFQNGKPRFYTPGTTKEAEWRIRTTFVQQNPEHQPWRGPVHVSVIAFLRYPKSIPKKRLLTAMPITRPDSDNYLKTVLDGLSGVAFVDDAQVVTMLIKKRYSDTPRWEILLETEKSP